MRKSVTETPNGFDEVFDILKTQQPVEIIRAIYLLLCNDKKEKDKVVRIKHCPVCDDMYFANKTNSITCGNKKCINGFQYEKKKQFKIVSETFGQKAVFD